MTKKKKDDVRCKATRRSAEHWGEPCKNRPVAGSDYCKFHGGASVGLKNGKGRPKGSPKPEGAGGRPLGNQNALKHGAYSARLAPDELPLYEAIKSRFTEELGKDNLSASDERLIHQLAVLSAKFDTAVEKGAPPEALNMLNKTILDLLRELKATRASKDLGPQGGNTPAEIMATLLMAVAERKELTEKSEPKPVAQAELPDVEPPFEVVEVADGQSADS